MSDIDEILRAQTTEPYIVIQMGDKVPTPDGQYTPAVLSFGNGMTPADAINAIMNIAMEIIDGNTQVVCADHDKVTREELLHARREPPYGG